MQQFLWDQMQVVGYQVPVREGDVLLWDPMVPHLAPKTKGAKTIISFNLN